MDKTIYVFGGTNGVGKSNIKDNFLKEGVPFNLIGEISKLNNLAIAAHLLKYSTYI